MPISKDQCDDFSARTAEHVRKQVLPILKAAMHREAVARATFEPGGRIVPWDLAAGFVAGVVGAAVEMMWAVCPADANKADAALPGMFAAMAASFLGGLEEPPGSFIRQAEANEQALAKQRRKMT